jgi:hypothetical protein
MSIDACAARLALATLTDNGRAQHSGWVPCPCVVSVEHHQQPRCLVRCVGDMLSSAYQPCRRLPSRRHLPPHAGTAAPCPRDARYRCADGRGRRVHAQFAAFSTASAPEAPATAPFGGSATVLLAAAAAAVVILLLCFCLVGVVYCRRKVRTACNCTTRCNARIAEPELHVQY